MSEVLVYASGVDWDGHEGTDRRLALALAREVPLLWVDPPPSWLRQRRGEALTPGRRVVDEVAPAVRRLRVGGPPAVTRIGVRNLAEAATWRALRSTVDGASVKGMVLSHGLMRFPRWLDSPKVYFVTDDWVAGAGLMGVSRRAVASRERDNARAADLVLSVSPSLTETVRRRTGADADVLPNGCTVERRATPAPALDLTSPVVGVTGQLNERLDLALLEAVAERDVSLLLVGPRRDRDKSFGARLDRLLERPNVVWVGEQPSAAMPAYLASLDVGLTPYADTSFNRASFPLKTLDYLAAGLPCVATPSPAVDWLDTDLVVTADSAEDFAESAVRAATGGHDGRVAVRKEFAERHSWEARARTLLDRLERLDLVTGPDP